MAATFTIMATPAFGAILVAAWGLGVALLGILSIVTGLAWALSGWPSDADGYAVTAGDLVFLGLLGFLGGIVTTFGVTIARWGARPAPKA